MILNRFSGSLMQFCTEHPPLWISFRVPLNRHLFDVRRQPRRNGANMESKLVDKSRKNSSSRRTFLSQVGGAAAATVGVSAIAAGPAALAISAREDEHEGRNS